MAGGPCGWALCIRSADRTILLDQATGRPRFTTTDDVEGTVTNGVVLVTRLHPGSDELPQPVDVLILDPDTGQVRSTVPRAYPIDWTYSDGRALLVQDGDGYTAFVAVEATGQTRILGRYDGSWVNCEARAEILACSDSFHLRVWTLPPREGGS